MKTIRTRARKWMLLSALGVLQLTASSRAAVDLGNVQVATLGHSFFKFPFPGMPNQVTDSLVDQDQSSGGGGMVQTFAADLDTNSQFVLTISAPPGQKFLVHPPAGQAVRFGGLLDWQGNGANGPSRYGTLAVSFGGLEGAAPDFSASRTVLSDLHGFMGFNDIQSTAFSNDLAFTSITLTATVPQTTVGVGTLIYSPTIDNALVLYYTTSQTNDPGRFVSIVPGTQSTNTPDCTFSISPGSRLHGFGSETGSVTVTAQEGCPWSVANTIAWVTITSSLNNSNSGVVSYTVASNPLTTARSGFINIAGQNFIINQSAAPPTGPGTITFDDLSPGRDGIGIPNGYHGLQWNNFAVYCGACRPATEGYRTGMVSPTNVAFNPYGDPASISSSHSFDLHSAYLTAAWNLDTAVDIQVQGFVGTELTYDNTYTVTKGAPTLIHFDYLEVNQVRFISSPSVQFAMDDLAITFAGGADCNFLISPGGRLHGSGSETGTVSVATQDGCTWSVLNTNAWVTILSTLNNSNSGTVTYAVAANPTPLARSGFINIAGQRFSLSQSAASSPAIMIGPVEVSSIGRSVFNPNPLPHPFPQMPRSEVHFLIDQDQSSGGGGVLPSVSINWDTNTQFALTISAPAGQKFSVQVPAGNAVGFGGFLWWESTRGGESPVGPVSVTFEGLEGTPPVFSGSDAVLSYSHGYFGFFDLEGTTVTNDFAFTSITLTGTVLPQYTGNGTENYIPHRESSMQLFFTTLGGSAPGGSVSIVPVNPLPAIRVAAMSPGIGPVLSVNGRTGRTNVVECSEDLIHWTAIATNVMPATVIDVAGTNSPYRFYRTFELP